MSALTLGQPVTITDYLVRAELRPKQALSLADRWADMPAKVAEAVQRYNGREDGQVSMIVRGIRWPNAGGPIQTERNYIRG